MFIETKSDAVKNLGSGPRDDLRDAAYAFKPSERGYEYSFQQYDGTDLFQWHRRSGVYWGPCGPLLALEPVQ